MFLSSEGLGAKGAIALIAPGVGTGGGYIGLPRVKGRVLLGEGRAQDMTGESVREELHGDEVDQSELEEVLSRHFGTSTASSPDTIQYPGTADFALELRYEDGQLVEIVAGPALTRLELTGVRERIEAELLTATGTAVGRVVLFASVPMTGYFRYPASPLAMVARDIPVSVASPWMPPRPSSWARCATNSRACNSLSTPKTLSHERSEADNALRVAMRV